MADDSAPTQWEYVTHLIKNPQVNGLDRTLRHFGRGGWELVTMTSTIKFWNRALGNDLVMVFKRPTNKPADLALRRLDLFDDQGTPIKDPGPEQAPKPGPARPTATPDEGYHGA